MSYILSAYLMNNIVYKVSVFHRVDEYSRFIVNKACFRLAINMRPSEQLYKENGVCDQFQDIPNNSDSLHSNSMMIRELTQETHRSGHVRN